MNPPWCAFRDPIHDGAADPTVIWNRGAAGWWMFYTNRRVLSRGAAIENQPHEGPNVFALGGFYWMLTDEWASLRVHRSTDLRAWETQDRILAESGSGADDGGNGLHADVVVVGDDAFVFYFTHPRRGADRADPAAGWAGGAAMTRRHGGSRRSTPDRQYRMDACSRGQARVA